MAESSYGRAARFEERAAIDDIAMEDIHFSRLSGMGPDDIEFLRIFSVNEALLIVIRCPKRNARYYHGVYPAKTFVTKTKSDDEGLVTSKSGHIQVSDYDLMCVYRLSGPGEYEKIFFSGIDPTNSRSALPREATIILQRVNPFLKSKFQHGAQDDYIGKGTPGVKIADGKVLPDRFAAFELGRCHYMGNSTEAKKFYLKRGLDWPYDDKGAHTRKLP